MIIKPCQGEVERDPLFWLRPESDPHPHPQINHFLQTNKDWWAKMRQTASNPLAFMMAKPLVVIGMLEYHAWIELKMKEQSEGMDSVTKDDLFAGLAKQLNRKDGLGPDAVHPVISTENTTESSTTEIPVPPSTPENESYSPFRSLFGSFFKNPTPKTVTEVTELSDMSGYEEGTNNDIPPALMEMLMEGLPEDARQALANGEAKIFIKHEDEEDYQSGV